MIIPVRDRAGLDEFIRAAESLYHDDPNWIQPLIGNRPHEFSAKTNPGIRYHKIQLFVYRKDNRPLGRIAAFTDDQYNKIHSDKTAFFGFFECIDYISAARDLLSAAEDFAKSNKMEKIIGPVDFSTNYQAGLLVAGYNRPTVMTPYNKDYYPQLIESLGYAKLTDLLAYLHHPQKSVPERLIRLAELQVKRHPEIVVESIANLRSVNKVRFLTRLYDEAFSGNWGYVPMSSAEFSHLVKTLDHLGCADLNYLAFFKGKPVGFLLSMPDLYAPDEIAGSSSAAFRKLRVTTLGVAPAYRNKGIETVMGVKMLSDAKKRGYEEIEFSVVLENNAPMNNYIRREFGLQESKRFRIYQKFI